MKNVKKLLALLLAMTMLFALCACGGGDSKKDDKKDEEKKEAAGLTDADLNGEWTLTTIPAALKFDEAFAFEGFSVDDIKITTKAVIKDGQMELSTDGIVAWIRATSDKLHDWIGQGDNVYSFFATVNNMSVEDYKEVAAAEGITKQDLLDEMTVEISKDDLFAMFMDGFGDDKTIDYSFMIKDGKLHFEGGAIWTIELADGKIYVLKIDNGDDSVTMNKGGMVFSK